MSAKTITAVYGTRAGRDEQDAALIFVQQAGHERCLIVAHRIGDEPRRIGQFVDQRQDLQQQRVGWIAGAHLRHIATWNKERKISRGVLSACETMIRQTQDAAQFSDVTDCLLDEGLPRGQGIFNIGADRNSGQRYNQRFVPFFFRLAKQGM
jgi:hypothetical protein